MCISEKKKKIYIWEANSPFNLITDWRNNCKILSEFSIGDTTYLLISIFQECIHWLLQLHHLYEYIRFVQIFNRISISYFCSVVKPCGISQSCYWIRLFSCIMLYKATIYNILWQAADGSADKKTRAHCRNEFTKSSLRRPIWSWTTLLYISVSGEILVSRIMDHFLQGQDLNWIYLF